MSVPPEWTSAMVRLRSEAITVHVVYTEKPLATTMYVLR